MSRSRRAQAVVLAAVEEALQHLEPEPVDGGAVALARRYADTIDQAPAEERAAVLGALGPKLLVALEALTMTPRARAALAQKGGLPRDPGAPVDPLDRLRDEHAARAAGAGGVGGPH